MLDGCPQPYVEYAISPYHYPSGRVPDAILAKYLKLATARYCLPLNPLLRKSVHPPDRNSDS